MSTTPSEEAEARAAEVKAAEAEAAEAWAAEASAVRAARARVKARAAEARAAEARAIAEASAAEASPSAAAEPSPGVCTWCGAVVAPIELLAALEAAADALEAIRNADTHGRDLEWCREQAAAILPQITATLQRWEQPPPEAQL